MKNQILKEITDIVSSAMRDHITNNAIRSYSKILSVVAFVSALGIYSLFDWLKIFLENFSPQNIEQMLEKHPYILLVIIGIMLWRITGKALDYPINRKKEEQYYPLSKK